MMDMISESRNEILNLSENNDGKQDWSLAYLLND